MRGGLFDEEICHTKTDGIFGTNDYNYSGNFNTSVRDWHIQMTINLYKYRSF